MRSSVFIGSEEVVYEGNINVEFAIDDIKSFNIGNLNRSYTISLPRIPANEKAIKNITLLNSSEQLSETGSIFVGGVKIISGAVKAYSFNDTHVKIYITGDDVVEEIKGKKLTDLDFSAETFALTAANVSGSWTGDDKFYRFPLCTWSRLWSEDAPGSSANWLPNDFVPMFRVKNIFEKIFPGWVIDGSFFSSTRGRNAYIMGRELIADNTFIENKGFNVKPTLYTENNNTKDWTATSIGSITVTKNPVSFNTETLDEAGAWDTGSDKYVVPATGTYRFIWNVKLKNSLETLPQFTVQSQSYDLIIQVNGSTFIREQASDPSVVLNDEEFTLDTGWIHLELLDEITCYAALGSAAENTGGAVTTNIGIDETDTNFTATFDRRNLYAGIGFTIEPSKYMEDMDQYDFVKAIKDDYNLRFIFDRYNRVIYVYNGADILGTNIRDITVDYSIDRDTDFIAKEYKRFIDFKYKHDDNDKAVELYYSGNREYPYEHSVELTNTMAQNGRDERISAFASTPISSPQELISGTDMIAIFGRDPDLTYRSIPAQRSNTFAPRLLQWYGLSAGNTFTYNNTLYTNQYPKALTPDKAELYAEFFASTIRRINVGKLIKLTRLITPDELNEFITEVADESKEGFRSMYRVQIKGEYVLLMLNNIVTDGYKAECEYVIL